MIRFEIGLTRLKDFDGWEMRSTAVREGQRTAVGAPRRLPRVSAGAGAGPGYPLPPPGEIATVDEDRVAELCASPDVTALDEVFMDVATKGRGDPLNIPTFASYLFATLIGSKRWAELLREAGGEDIELALRWRSDDFELSRLPWEMMRSHKTYLVAAEVPKVAISRLVPSPEGVPGRPQPRIAPKILIVVGSDPKDPAIRWGSEYVALLRHLERDGMTLPTKVVPDASPREVIAAIAQYRPSVVHFIGHGRVDEGRPVLVLRSDSEQEGIDESPLGGDQLAALFAEAGHLPEIVVLNACHSSAQPPSQIAAPMSAELVQSGVPIVIGMWGRIADVVCRLFTVRFYEALLEAKPIVAAAAAGRREGFMVGHDPHLNADWGFPSVFLADWVAPGVATDTDALAAAREVEAIARNYRAMNDPPVFCDRFDIFRAARRLLDPRVDHAVLVVREPQRPPREEDKHGKTRLLMELAAQAVREGCAPCLVTPAREVRTETPQGLSELIFRYLVRAREYLELPLLRPAECATHTLLSSEAQPEQVELLPDSVRGWLELRMPGDSELPRRALAAALAEDLDRLCTDTGRRPLLLIDEVHRLGVEALRFVREELARPGVLKTSRGPVPLVLALGAAPEDERAFAELQMSLRQRRRAGQLTVDLLPFPDPVKDPLPYEEYVLLGGDVRYAIATEDEQALRLFFGGLYAHTEGVPSRLTDDFVRAFIELAAKTKTLTDATDEREALLRERRA